ncbi:hypothetical protein SFRURICE_002548 [Spodoptera frugiperda]|nr:hypothetical protein SFRURICE_002548 [Spodoptera frugiperda]
MTVPRRGSGRHLYAIGDLFPTSHAGGSLGAHGLRTAGKQHAVVYKAVTVPWKQPCVKCVLRTTTPPCDRATVRHDIILHHTLST